MWQVVQSADDMNYHCLCNKHNHQICRHLDIKLRQPLSTRTIHWPILRMPGEFFSHEPRQRIRCAPIQNEPERVFENSHADPNSREEYERYDLYATQKRPTRVYNPKAVSRDATDQQPFTCHDGCKQEGEYE